MAIRDYSDPAYKKVRLQVLKRDKRKCRMPGCCAKRVRKEVHHIVPWSQAAYLRYEPSNMITLCKECHKEVTGNEGFYESLFREIVNAEHN